jgi:heme exporter protein A
MNFQSDGIRLTASRVSCERGGRLLFARLSIELSAGGAITVLGPNGAGKTSLLRMLAGLLFPAEGKIELRGGPGSIAEAVHFLGHLDAVKGALSVSENLDFARALLGGGGASNETALTRLGLGARGDLPAHVLSAGQRRRLALARLLVAPRPIWLLDEPTAALDAAGKEVLIGMMGEHRTRGGMVVVATHLELELEDAREIFISNGRAV